MLGKKTPPALVSLLLQAALAATCFADAGTRSTPETAALRSSGTGSAAIAVSILKGLAARRKGRRRTHDARNSAALLRALNTPGAPAANNQSTSK